MSTALLDSLLALRERVASAVFPLDVERAGEARLSASALTSQLDDYLLPRLRSLDAPLLAVVGGSTGAGKSTLVNSLVGQEVSPAGVLRPTTRAPVLVCNPADRPWFDGPRVLPGLARVTGASAEPGTLHLQTVETLAPGLALLDAPDIDSVVSANRDLAAQLLAAADLWLFVTTAARYADAVPWDLLAAARERSAAIAIVLDRVPPEAIADVRGHLASMLAERGLGAAPLLVVPETVLDEGLLPASALAPVRGWLDELAADAEARGAVVRRTLSGALDSLTPRVEALAAQADRQLQAAGALTAEAEAAFGAATTRVDHALGDGSLLRGEVLARWQEFVGTGELLRSLESQVGRLRDRIAATISGRPAPGSELQAALTVGAEALVEAEADRAAERTVESWRFHPGGPTLLEQAEEDLTRASRTLDDRAARQVREWQGDVLDLVRGQGAARRSTARWLSLGVNGVGLVLMVAVFAHTGGLTGAEVGVAGGTSVVSQKLLEAVFGDQAVRRLAAEARRKLYARVELLLDEEAARFTALIVAHAPDPELPGALRSDLDAISAAREVRVGPEGDRS